MVKFYERKDIFKYTWDQVAQGFWSRYPNPYSTHVLTEDTVSRYVDGGRLFSKRLLTKTNPVNRLPKWGERFIGARSVRIVEESVVDPRTKTIVTYTRNVGLQHIMSIEERCVYRPSPENPKHTLVERRAWISSSILGFSCAIQAFGVERFKQNAAKASKGFLYVLERLFPSPHPSEKERLRSKLATELAKAKAVPLVAAASYNNQQ
ncbi:PRELI domain-containing protein 1, mitochondrial-like [Ornithodoros turicata]|uniref:PRELI domain-containing protein 1, mitochondrial-like n=1 Tax=Ornithodoros turicata TaxID=34597 RepID=UPI003138CE66